MAKPGAMKDVKVIDDAARDIAVGQKAEIEAKAGKTFDTFTPTHFATQVVAGTNYFVKIDCGAEFVHARIFKDLSQAVSVHSVVAGKTADDALEYF